MRGFSAILEVLCFMWRADRGEFRAPRERIQGDAADLKSEFAVGFQSLELMPNSSLGSGFDALPCILAFLLSENDMGLKRTERVLG
ncbi:hypothetical protein CEY09_24455 [Achromobacter marplatensis]|nr:hypothetical protein CEY09_24455 [Achromobacter marplatensis]